MAIIVPLRNEEGNVLSLLKMFSLSEIEKDDIFIIEGNSSDSTFVKLNHQNQLYGGQFNIKKQNYVGKFGAVRTFMSDSRSNDFSHVFVWDGDMTIPAEDNLRLLSLASENQNCLVTGSRFRSALKNNSIPFVNLIGNFLFSLIWSLFTRSKPIDVLCGSKIVPIGDLRELPISIIESDYYGDISILFSARINKRQIISSRVKYIKREYGHSNIKPFSGGLKILHAIIACIRHQLH